MQRVLYEDFFLFYGGWHVRYEEMWKVFNISMSSLVSVCTAIFRCIFPPVIKFFAFFHEYQFQPKVLNVHTWRLDYHATIITWRLDRWFQASFSLCENFRFDFVKRESFTKNVSQSENAEKCRSGSVGYVSLASQQQAWTNSLEVYIETNSRIDWIEIELERVEQDFKIIEEIAT